jgi:hypothetical protein
MTPVKIVQRILVADVCNDFPCPRFIHRKLSIFHFLSDEITQDAPEIFMPGKRKETSAVCEHTNKSAQQTHVTQGIQLLHNTIFLVEKPPG